MTILTDPHDHPEPHTMKWTQAEMDYINNRVETAVRQALEQAGREVIEKEHGIHISQQKQEPEFTKHIVEATADWSEWVCPDPESYLMKCCDCGLVHEAQFGVVRYKSETEREDCDKVDNPNVQAVFRMRRIEQWTPEDMAHRAGGLPIEQAQKQEPVAYVIEAKSLGAVALKLTKEIPIGTQLYTSPPQRQPLTDEQIDAFLGDSPFTDRLKLDKSAYEVVQRTNPDWREVISNDPPKHWGDFETAQEARIVRFRLHVRWVLDEAAHGIKE